MKKQKHTPAPWQVAEYLGDEKEIMGRNEMHVAFVTHLNDANAALICAAPDLLAACKAAEDWLSSFSMPPTATIQEKQEMLAMLEKAIAKATAGREPSTTESKE